MYVVIGSTWHGPPLEFTHDPSTDGYQIGISLGLSSTYKMKCVKKDPKEIYPLLITNPQSQPTIASYWAIVEVLFFEESI